MKILRYWWIEFLLISFLATLSFHASASSKKIKVLRINIGSEPNSLHPMHLGDIISGNVVNHLFEGLVVFDNKGEISLGIAKSIKISEDKKTYTFILRDDALWSNGEKIRAQDFVYTLRKHLTSNNRVNPAFLEFLFYIKGARELFYSKEQNKKLARYLGVKAIDDKTLQIKLENPTPYFLKILASAYVFLPVNEKIDKNNPNWAKEAGKNYISNSAFVLKKWDHNHEIILEKNPYFYNHKKVKLDRIIMVMVDSPQSAWQMFKKGQLDWIGMPFSPLASEVVAHLKKEKKLNSQPLVGGYWLALNMDKPPFNNLNIRRAFSLAINRSDLVKYVLEGGQMPALGIISPIIWDNNYTSQDFSGNIKKAKNYFAKGMKELGISSVNDFPAIHYSFNSSDQHQKIALALQNMWQKALGIKVILENSDYKVHFIKMRQGDFNIGRSGWFGTYDDAMSFFEGFYELQGGINYSHWGGESQRKFHDLLDKARISNSEKQREKILKQANKIFLQSQPVIPLFFHSNDWVASPKLKNIHHSPLGQVWFNYVDKIE